ncbi:MAG: long-chain-fatty-acid--CoA ligase [Thermodesulfobacteriota bacterium]|nr:long-chain-fatty-acid--CoA ligase [Thermodesulfobacteriota bacterium]
MNQALFSYEPEGLFSCFLLFPPSAQSPAGLFPLPGKGFSRVALREEGEILRIQEILWRSARFYADRVALVCGGEQFTYGQFRERVNRLANGLSGLGARHGDRIAALLPNCHRFAELYLAGAQLGAVLVPLNVRLSPQELMRLMDHSEARGLVSGGAFRQTVQAMAGMLPRLPFRVGWGLQAEGFLDYEDLIRAGSPRWADFDFNEGEVAIQMYTSGTTGTPKGVLLTHGNLLANTLTGIFERRFSCRDVFLNAAPLYHIADVEYFLQILSVGGTNVFIGRFDPLPFLEAVQRERVTGTWIVPTMIHDLLACPDLARYDVSSLRTIFYGGACLSPDLFFRAQKVFPCQFSLGFGLTEASPLISLLRPEDHQGEAGEVGRRLRSCGRAAFNVEVRIVDEEGKRVTPGQVGEIVVRGANVMKGYWKMDQETQWTLRGGWLHTGDLAWMDEEGYLFLVDRKKDVIKSGGENIYSREVEEVIASHPAVREVAVIGIPDDRWSEAVKAVIVLREGVPCSEKEILEHCRLNLAGFKQPKSVVFVPSLPKNITGKVLKTELREMYPRSSGGPHGF